MAGKRGAKGACLVVDSFWGFWCRRGSAVLVRSLGDNISDVSGRVSHVLDDEFLFLFAK